jgi:hypothetical protein
MPVFFGFTKRLWHTSWQKKKYSIYNSVHTLSSSVSNLIVTWSSIMASTPALTKSRQSDSSNSLFNVSKDLLLGNFCKKKKKRRYHASNNSLNKQEF